MYFLHDNDHWGRGGEGFETALAATLAETEDATLYLERAFPSAERKAHVDALHRGLLDGDVELVRADERSAALDEGRVDGPNDRWEPGEHALVADGTVWETVGRETTHAVVLEAAAADPEAFDRIETEPHHEWLDREAVERIHGTPVARETGSSRRAWRAAREQAERDETFAESIEADVAAGRSDPDEAVVVMGAAHRLDDRLRSSFDVEVRNPVAARIERYAAPESVAAGPADPAAAPAPVGMESFDPPAAPAGATAPRSTDGEDESGPRELLFAAAGRLRRSGRRLVERAESALAGDGARADERAATPDDRGAARE